MNFLWEGGRLEEGKIGRGEGWKRWKGGGVEGWKGGRVEGWNGDRVCKVFGMCVVFIAILRTTYILIIAVAHSSLIVLLGCVKNLFWL